MLAFRKIFRLSRYSQQREWSVKQTNNGEIESSYAGKYEETTLSTAV
jgi:hypothetical protein